MSLDKIAKILNVDEVNLMHGPKGVALYVRVDETWQCTTINNEKLGHGTHRLETMTKGLVDVADGLNKSLGRDVDLRKALSGGTRAALEADRAVEQRRMLSWSDVGGFDRPRDGLPQQQVQRSVDVAPLFQAPPPAQIVPASSAPMPSRFHAIMAELGDL